MARFQAVRLAAALLACFAIAQAQDTSAVTPRDTIQSTAYATAIDSNVASLPNSLEWNTASIGNMQCAINGGNDKSSPICPTSGGPNNAYFLAPMVQAGDALGTKPILGMVYAHKECNGACSDAATQCRICVVALANRRSGGALLTVDPDVTQNWVSIEGYSGKVVTGADASATPVRFSPLLVDGQLQGFEACTAFNQTLASGALVVPVGSSSVTIDAHLHIEYNTAGNFETARLQRASPGGIPVSLEACEDPTIDPAPSCETPPTLTAGAAEDLTAEECTSSTSYRVMLTAANSAGSIAAPAACQLETDGRNPATGSGPVSFVCGPLDRGATHNFEFTASPADTECASIKAAVSVAPPALETVTFAAEAPSDAACGARSGALIFSVAANRPLSEAQYNGATLAVTLAGAAVEGCSTVASADGFEVACDGLAAGDYLLAVAVPNTQYPGCPHTGSVTGTVSVIPAPGFQISDLPAAQTICPAATTTFGFTVTDAGDGLVYAYSPEGTTATCGQPGEGGAVTCEDVGASVTVAAVAQYGAAQDKECTTDPVTVPLTVEFEHAIAAASVTASSLDKLCPAVPSAEVAFSVATTLAADSLSAALLDATTQEPVPDVTCTATATDGSGLNWAVSCPGAPVGGSYVLALVATSARGCQYDLGVDATAVATVSAYDYALSAGADLSAFACVGSLGKATVTVQATGLDGAEFSAVAPGTAAICTRTPAEGVVFECTGLPAGPTEVVVTVVETGCTLTDSVIIDTTVEPCCYTRTIGYWGTHGEEMKPWLVAAPIKLWGRTFTAGDMTAGGSSQTCSSDKPDALRVLCVTGQKMCSAAQLARQCMAARVNLAITSKCGDADNCFNTANINRERLFACCGEDGPAPSGAAAQGCINDVSAFNQDKSAIGNTCAASELPQGGPGLTQKVCNDYSSAFSKATLSQFCVQGFCSTSTTGAWGRRRLLDV